MTEFPELLRHGWVTTYEMLAGYALAGPISAPATVLASSDGSARILFDAPVRAVAPGQSCVFYDGDVVIGGGVLRKLTADS